MSLDPGGTVVEGIDLSSMAASGNGEIGQPIDLPDGAFLGKSVPACIKLYLSASRKKKTSKEITAALRDGGVESTSGSFDNVVTTALNRLRTAGEVLKFKDGWGLSEWYPANMRTGGSAGKQVTKGKKKTKKGKPKTTAAAPVSVTGDAKKITEITKTADKPEARMLAFFKENDRETSPSEIATTLGLDSDDPLDAGETGTSKENSKTRVG